MFDPGEAVREGRKRWEKKKGRRDTWRKGEESGEALLLEEV